jgi:tRNA/tmRNA/rRNA uracil-C5-methylase (TrmA/RlmC/RlmD family)
MELCSVFGKCGGCEFLDIEYDEQLKNKEKKSLKYLKILI